jgi:dolichol-phosphate mannosyltransferase
MMTVSVTIPVFNEEAVIEKVIGDCYSEIIEKIPGSELIVVNDGSTDGTFRILERLKQKLALLKVIHLEENRGHGKALRVAFDQACKSLVFHMDGDNQFSVKDFWHLYERMEGNDIAAGYRISRHDRLHRKVISFVLRWINIAFFGVSLKDVNAPFKLIRTNLLHDIMKDVPRDFSAIPIVLCMMAKLQGYRIVEVPVTHFERKTGKSSMAGFYLWSLCSVYLMDLMKFKRLITGGQFKKT